MELILITQLHADPMFQCWQKLKVAILFSRYMINFLISRANWLLDAVLLPWNLSREVGRDDYQ
jgi:hypothetical protein